MKVPDGRMTVTALVLKQRYFARQPRPSRLFLYGTLGLLFVLPIVAGAYLGQWLDETLVESSINWTLNLMFLGIAIGVVNVWLLIRRN
mgnify:CR=1 FL=1